MAGSTPSWLGAPRDGQEHPVMAGSTPSWPGASVVARSIPLHSGAPCSSQEHPSMFRSTPLCLGAPRCVQEHPLCLGTNPKCPGRGTGTPTSPSRRTWETSKGRGKVCPCPRLRPCPRSPSQSWARLLLVGTRLTGRVALVPTSGGRELTVSPLPAGQSELFHVLRVQAGGGSGRQGPGDPAAPEGRPAPPELAAGAGGVLRHPDRRAGGAAGRQERSHRGAPAGRLGWGGALPGARREPAARTPPTLLRRSWRRSCRRRRTTRRSKRS